MSSNKTLQRTVGSVSYDAGSTVELDLPKSHYFQSLDLLLDWTVTPGTSASQNGNGILDLISEIEVKYDGDSTPYSVGLAMSHYYEWLRQGTQPTQDRVDFSSNTQQTGQVLTAVPFTMDPAPDAGLGTLLPAFAFSDLKLRIKWANSSAVGDDTTVDDATLTVQTSERRKAALTPKPQQARKLVKQLKAWKHNERSVALQASGETTVDLPVGNGMHAVAVEVIDADSPDNQLVETIRLEENTSDVHKDVDFSMLRVADEREYGVDTVPTGYGIANYGLRADTTDVVDTSGMDQYQLVVDTGQTAPTDPAEVRVHTMEIV